MENFTLLDNQKRVVHTNPVTATGRPNPTMVPQTFSFANDNNAALAVSQIPGSLDLQVVPRAPFFGPDKIAMVTWSIAKTSQGPVIAGGCEITIQGSLPDDGTLDHFEPTADPPVPQ